MLLRRLSRSVISNVARNEFEHKRAQLGAGVLRVHLRAP
jgi:hypothetical protein